MAQKAIREGDGKRMMARLLKEYSGGKYSVEDKYVTVGPETDMAKLPAQYKWLTKEKLVVKPDQLIKRRGKNKLILVGANFEEARKWINEKSKAPSRYTESSIPKGSPLSRGQPASSPTS